MRGTAYISFLSGIVSSTASIEAKVLALQATADISLREDAPEQHRSSEPAFQFLLGDSCAVLRFDEAIAASAVGSGRIASVLLEPLVRFASAALRNTP